MAVRMALLTTGLIWAMTSQDALAQFNSGVLAPRFDGMRQYNRRNTVSPYLNLVNLGGGTSGQAAANFSLPNYQTLVQPQIRARQQAMLRNQQLNQLQGQVQDLRTDMQQQQEQGVSYTGHPTRFMTYLHYYPQFGP